jgi:hypothetical protein
MKSDFVKLPLGILFMLIFVGFNTRVCAQQRWLEKSGFGLMFHYEAFKNHNSESYNKAIDSFDVARFVAAVESTTANHIIFVVGQHWGKYCAPNSAYEKLLGVENGVWTSKRDLIMEIGQELKKRDIKLILYKSFRRWVILFPVLTGSQPDPMWIRCRTRGRSRGFCVVKTNRPIRHFLKTGPQCVVSGQNVMARWYRVGGSMATRRR